MTDVERNWFTNDVATFGDRLAAAREALGLSQEDLAQRLGVALETLEAWETDAAEPRANRLQMLAGVLNVSVMWLLTGEGQGVDETLDDQPADIRAALGDLRRIRAEMARLAEETARVEKRIRKALVETGQ
ncbi:MAG: XRE family transcriptional regulator [Alphaproteobacteria bacterium]|nr:MAG: XRE family transcriptional regulator [Alphaproteobacteria bacterium]